MLATKNRLGMLGGWLMLGATVFIVMQVGLLYGYLRQPVSAAALVLGFFNTLIFFTLPVALYVNWCFFRKTVRKSTP